MVFHRHTHIYISRDTNPGVIMKATELLSFDLGQSVKALLANSAGEFACTVTGKCLFIITTI